MEKKIIRTQVVRGISSRIILAFDEEDTLLGLSLKHGKDKILHNIFDEKNLSYQELLAKYMRFSDGERCTEFETMYLIKPGFGVVVNEHIYLYHYNEDIRKQQEEIFPWIYMESKTYLGDPWWFDDDEIVEDIQNLPIIEFLEKYKGY